MQSVFKTKSKDLLRLHQYSGQALRQTCFTRGSRGTTSGYYGVDRPVTLINFLSPYKSNSLKLRSFPPGSTISKWQRLLSPIVPFISLIGFIHSPNCSIFRQRFLIQPSVYFTRVDMKYRYLQFAQIWNTILRNAVNCCSARIATLQSNCFQYPG